MKKQITLPDLGEGIDNAEVSEVSVSVGDSVEKNDTLIVLESDKASMEIPSPVDGRVVALSVNEGNSVTQGDPIAEVELRGSSAPQASRAESSAAGTACSAEGRPRERVGLHLRDEDAELDHRELLGHRLLRPPALLPEVGEVGAVEEDGHAARRLELGGHKGRQHPLECLEPLRLQLRLQRL